MTIKLFIQAVIKFLSGFILVGLLIFLSAGTFLFKNGLLFMGMLFIPMLLSGIVMMFRSPELLKKRLNGKEQQKEQNFVVKLCGLMFISGFIIAGMDFRFSWYILPTSIVNIATVVFIASYILYAEVLREMHT